jgi:signal peptidase I
MLLALFFSGTEIPLAFALNDTEIKAPSNWINEKDINIYDNAVVINIKGASLSKYAPTGSMLPLLDENSNGIRIVPKSEQDIKIGDIITYERNEELIVHRIIKKGTDEKGTWFITKGDNNEAADEKIRYEDIRYKTIGILW